jgi:hypothetical protein
MTLNDNRRTTETPVQARQGFLDRPVLVVLIVALILAGIALVIAYGVAW